MKKTILLLLFVHLALILLQFDKNETTITPYIATDSALVQVQLIETELGPIPSFDCEDGMFIPIYVNGIEVFEDQPKKIYL